MTRAGQLFFYLLLPLTILTTARPFLFLRHDGFTKPHPDAPRYWPAVDERKLVPDYSGIRPKLRGPALPSLFDDRPGNENISDYDSGAGSGKFSGKGANGNNRAEGVGDVIGNSHTSGKTSDNIENSKGFNNAMAGGFTRESSRNGGRGSRRGNGDGLGTGNDVASSTSNGTKATSNDTITRKLQRPDGILDTGTSTDTGYKKYASISAADFEIQGTAVHGVEGLVNLMGIESPGLTSSIAIAEYVARLVEGEASP